VCKGDFELLNCFGGELVGGCKTTPRCDSFCNVSAKAKAACRQPDVKTDFEPLDVGAPFIAALQKYLPIIYTLQQRVDGMFKATSTFPTMLRELTDIKPECVPLLLDATDVAVGQISNAVVGAAAVLGLVESPDG